MYREEKDTIGEKQIPENALYGIHSARARDNFPCNSAFPSEWYRAIGLTKLACYNTYNSFRDALIRKRGTGLPLKLVDEGIISDLIISAREVSECKYFEDFIVPGIQGGAGTSMNMNVNEIIANSALIRRGHRPGEYNIIDPVEHSNIYQSTNDVIPTALTVAVMMLLNSLENSINRLRQMNEGLERKGRDHLRPGYTQMQEAVPSSIGILFGNYSEALSRDWWRVSKCQERLKTINLGGGAAGTGLSVPRYFIMEVVPELRRITGLNLSSGENLPDATSNLDKWVEVHAILKAHAVNLEKISGDIRLLASDLAAGRLFSIPPRQTGSSIMPGKVNPVIPEFVISVSHKVYSNDSLITTLCAQGCLDLNAYLPVIGISVIESINILIAAGKTLSENLLAGLSFNEGKGYEALMRSPVITTALIHIAGYNKAAELAKFMKDNGTDIFEANSKMQIVDKETLERILEPRNLLKLGFSVEEL